MKLFVGTNFDDLLLDELAELGVYEVYGKGLPDEMGGARPSFLNPIIGKKGVARHIQKARKLGIRFNYLLNGMGMDNLEYTRKGHRKIHKVLDWLSEMEVDAVTITMPYLMRIVSRHYPHIQITVSSLANTDSVQKIRFWEDLGASAVTVNHVLCNRDFPLLKMMARATDMDVRVIVNNGCLYSCPWSIYHPLISTLASQKGHWSRGYFIDSCTVECRLLKHSKPEELIKADWIRPEDLTHYEEIGIDSFKIVDRALPTKEILLRTRAYANRSYPGNLLDLFEPMESEKPSLYKRIKQILTFFRPRYTNPFHLPRLATVKMDHDKIHIDNTKLDGFIAKFKSTPCMTKDCEDCGYCKEWANKVLTIDSGYAAKTIEDIQSLKDSLENGSFFHYRHPDWLQDQEPVHHKKAQG